MPRAAHDVIADLPRAPAPPQVPRDPSFEEQKRSFLRMASHELRTPLNSILGFSEILARELYGPMGAPQYREYAEIIRGSGAKLLKLVNQVLEIARLESGAAELHLAREPLEAALDDVQVSLKEDLAARDVRLSLCPVAGETAVMADPRALRTVLGNLIQNAVGFSPQGGEVRISLGTAAHGVEIVIADDGEGVDPADLPRLLKPFEQGENALTRRTHGAGLGLSICELYCEAMGGKLTLASAPGQGMTARVWLPAA